MAELWPGIIIMVGVYVTARILNHREAKRALTAEIEREIERRNKIDALYGRRK